ncbi:MAG: hypothetical protein GC189_10230 [Alphaproteobacteria bacterium]|nr:hypothetical protein [Alphaproteobacteria bacterium]
MFLSAALGALVLAQAATAPLAAAPDRLTRCLALVDEDATRAYEEAMAWAAETHEADAYRCAALSLTEQGRYEEAARRLQALATAFDGGEPEARAELLMQAGNAWLLAREPGQARSVLTRAIVLVDNDTDVLPDLLIDRARAYAAETDWRKAEEDLSRALDLRSNDPLALRLRAVTRGQQGAFDLALADAQAAVNADPADVESRLVLGHVREAQRTGAMPVE